MDMFITKVRTIQEVIDQSTRTIRRLAVEVETEFGPKVLYLTTSAARELRANLETILQGKRYP
jgi:hypothetical protein